MAEKEEDTVNEDKSVLLYLKRGIGVRLNWRWSIPERKEEEG